MARELAEAMVQVYDDSLLDYPRTMAGLAVDVSAIGPISFPLGEDFWIRNYYQPTELDLAAHSHWDELLHIGWYEGRPAPEPPTGSLRLMSAALLPIDPALRPGLLPVKRF